MNFISARRTGGPVCLSGVPVNKTDRYAANTLSFHDTHSLVQLFFLKFFFYTKYLVGRPNYRHSTMHGPRLSFGRIRRNIARPLAVTEICSVGSKDVRAPVGTRRYARVTVRARRRRLLLIMTWPAAVAARKRRRRLKGAKFPRVPLR